MAPLLAFLLLAAPARAVSVDRGALKAEIDKALALGRDFSFETNVAGHLGFDKSLAAKELVAPAQKAEDGMTHSFFVVLRDGKPFRVVFWAKRKVDDNEVSHAFAAQTDGRLRRAVTQDDCFDETGRFVKGTIADLKIHSDKVADAYQHELDFWLRGMYRR